MTNKVYISGGITGVKDYYEIFTKAEVRLIQAGYETVNPVDTIAEDCSCPVTDNEFGDGLECVHHTWICAMRYDIVAMMQECDKIALLPNWYSSRGARVEYTLATGLGFEVGTVDQWIERAK